MSGRFTRSAYVAAVTLALAACQQAPKLGPHVSAPPPKGPSIAIGAAEVDAARRVVVTVQVTRDGNPLGLEAARALGPAFTLAALGTEPVSGLPAWRSLVLSGAETLESLPVAGPGTPLAAVLVNARQPGADSEGSWIEKGSGTFTYTFATALPQEQSLSETLRVGVFLVGVQGTVLTTSTYDFVPDHSPLMGRELVVDGACATCHGLLRAHGGSRTGTRICVTCHTYQHADGQTVDPAAPAAATPTTDPNPLELGRLVHRIHRGKNLPTLYAASTASAGALVPASQPYGDVPPPAPFRAGANKLPLDPVTKLPDPKWIGRRFSVVGELSRERVFSGVTSRSDNGQPGMVLAAGVTFPRDYRSCDACHTNKAAQVGAIETEISRRTCHGCHTDVWFGGPVAPATEALPPDVFHLAHPGGPQPDDSRCKDCHVPTAASPDVRVPMKDAHVAPYQHARYSKPVVEIVSVTDLKPGLTPTIVFKVSDRNGPIRDLVNPSPSMDGNVPASNVPRALSRITIALAGPAAPDFRTLGTATVPLSEYVVGDSSNPTKPVPTSDSEGRFTYTFPDTKKIPAGTDGTWLVVIEARRSAPTAVFEGGRFVWPYTGENISETADNAIAWVDTAAGTLGGGAPSAAPDCRSRQVQRLSPAARAPRRRKEPHRVLRHVPHAGQDGLGEPAEGPGGKHEPRREHRPRRDVRQRRGAQPPPEAVHPPHPHGRPRRFRAAREAARLLPGPQVPRHGRVPGRPPAVHALSRRWSVHGSSPSPPTRCRQSPTRPEQSGTPGTRVPPRTCRRRLR